MPGQWSMLFGYGFGGHSRFFATSSSRPASTNPTSAALKDDELCRTCWSTMRSGRKIGAEGASRSPSAVQSTRSDDEIIGGEAHVTSRPTPGARASPVLYRREPFVARRLISEGEANSCTVPSLSVTVSVRFSTRVVAGSKTAMKPPPLPGMPSRAGLRGRF
jgi:hypothetical protein